MSVSIDIQKLKPAIAKFDFNKYKEKMSELNLLQKGKMKFCRIGNIYTVVNVFAGVGWWLAPRAICESPLRW